MARVKKRYIADGIEYKNAAILKIHKEFKENKLVKNFTLPFHVEDKKIRSKYGAYKAEVNGIVFDSILEARYYVHLLGEKEKKNIKGFERQVVFNLLPKGKNKFKNKTFLAVNYISDFVLEKPDGSKVVIDVKGKKTPDFKIKEKLFMLKNPDLEFICIQWDSHEKAWRDLDDIEKDKRARKRAKLKGKAC